MLAEHGHEVLARTVFEVEHSGPQPRGAGGASSLDHRLETVRAIGEARQNGRHADADVDAGGDQLLDGTQSLLRMRGAWFGPAPDVVIERRDAESDVEAGATRELGQYVDVADDHRSARDHPSGV